MTKSRRQARRHVGLEADSNVDAGWNYISGRRDKDEEGAGRKNGASRCWPGGGQHLTGRASSESHPPASGRLDRYSGPPTAQIKGAPTCE